MVDFIRSKFYWPGYLQDVDIFLRTCEDCLKRGNRRRPRAPLQIYTSGAPFSRVAIDTLGPFRKTLRGNRFLIVLVCCFIN